MPPCKNATSGEREFRELYRSVLHLYHNFVCCLCVCVAREVQLVEREQELCVFYERLNELVKMIEKSNLEIQNMEDEICNLKIEQKEQDRQTNLQKKQLSIKRTLEEESILLQIQVLATQF